MLTGLAKAVQACHAPGCNERAMVFDQGNQWCPVHTLDLVRKKARRQIYER